MVKNGAEEKCIQYIRQSDQAYPEKLKVHPNMPKGLYLIGRMPDFTKPSVAIVGARRSSPYGNELAVWFGMELARAGVQIISGMAWGIDGYAHEGALKAGGATFAVLGSGADVCYPSGHRRMYEEIRRTGGILSEQSPGTPPMPFYFPARNRIISGLADLVLVVEAREKSGSLITADYALEQGKDVFAVPGRIGDDLSRGCINLLKQGAGLADCPGTVLEALGISDKKREGQRKDAKISLAKDENIVYSWIRLQPISLQELAMKTGFSPSRLIPLLVKLQLCGCIREIRKNEYVRVEE